MSRPRCAFVILSSDEAGLLDASLAAAAGEPFAGGLVIDNASADATATVAERHGVPVLALERRVPYTEAMNAGLAALLGLTPGAPVDPSSGGGGSNSLRSGEPNRPTPPDLALGPAAPEFVALLQADTFVAPGYLDAGLAALVARPDVGSVAPKLIRTTGADVTQRLELIDAAAMSFDRRRKNSLVGHGQAAGRFSEAAEVFGADGAAALWRAEALADCAIEGRVFDENMPGWGCDADLAWRAQLLGWRSFYTPAARVHHIRTYSPTTRARARPVDRATQFRNRLLMIAKNDSAADLRRDLVPLVGYEILALGYALMRERELLGGYRDFWRRLPEARRQRRLIQARRQTATVPFGLVPPR